MRTYTYSAYGMTVQLPFPCPGLRAAEPGVAADVVVEEGPVPSSLITAVVREDWCEAEPGRLLLKGGPRAGRFLVEDGRVKLERHPGAEDPILAQLFTAPVLAAVLRQRGMLVLHANVAVTQRGVVVLAGRSGAGKSTAAAALLARGCAMVADDVTALRLAADGIVEALPGSAQIHLTEEAARGLGYTLSPERQTRRGMKAALPIDNNMARSAGRLQAIYVLDTHGGSEVRVTRLAGADRFDALQLCVYGPLFAEEHAALFALCAAVATQVEVYRIERPWDRWSIEELIDVLLSSRPGGG